MDFVYVVIGINILLIFLYKREWLLEKHPFKILLSLNGLLFLLSCLFLHYSIGNPKVVPALKMPLISQVLFIVLVTVFRKIYHRDPVDTFWAMDITLMKDGIFNFLFWLLGGFIPAFLAFKGII